VWVSSGHLELMLGNGKFGGVASGEAWAEVGTGAVKVVGVGDIFGLGSEPMAGPSNVARRAEMARSRVRSPPNRYGWVAWASISAIKSWKAPCVIGVMVARVITLNIVRASAWVAAPCSTVAGVACSCSSEFLVEPAGDKYILES